MSDLVSALEALKPENLEEKSIEVKDVIVKLSFQFEDGEIKDPVQAQIYDMLATNNAIIEESDLDEANTSEEDEFSN